jgi:hypothetical protein
MCLGVFLSPDRVEDVTAYMEVASRVNVDAPESRDLDDAVIRAWAEYSVQNRAWLQQMAAREFVLFADQGRDPKWPGNAGIKACQLEKADGTAGVGVDRFAFLDGLVQARAAPPARSCSRAAATSSTPRRSARTCPPTP